VSARPSLWPPPRWLRPPWADVALAAAFVVFALLAGWYHHRSGGGDSPGPLRIDFPTVPKPPGADRPIRIVGSGASEDSQGASVAGLCLLMAVPLAWRRRLPLAVLVVQFVGVFALREIGWVGFLAVLVGAYSLARYGRWPLLSLGTLLAAAGLVAATFQNATPNLPGWSAPFVILLPIGLGGAAIRSARARADASAERAALLEREREAATRAAVADERSRIARELHDVVSHHVSVMTIQAGAAGRVLDDRPDLARGAIGAIEASGREAMAELRHLLGVLAEPPAAPVSPAGPGAIVRPDSGAGDAGAAADPAPVPLRPQPGLDQLDALVAAVRAAGQPVTTRTRVPTLSGGVDLAAYRVVQEALTNALRYAPGARTEVVVDRDGDTLLIEVTDDGVHGDAPRHPAPGAGTGLIGLAERLGLYHGTLEAGRRVGGGFRVRARIPLEPA
jgi:signal transduction histidine kinase